MFYFIRNNIERLDTKNMQPIYFFKLMVFLLTVCFVCCNNESKRNPAPSIGPVKYEVIGKYLGYYLSLVSTSKVSRNTVIALTSFPCSMELDCSGKVIQLLLFGNSLMTQAGIPVQQMHSKFDQQLVV